MVSYMAFISSREYAMPEVPPSSEDELYQGLVCRRPNGVAFWGVARRFVFLGVGDGESESEVCAGEGEALR